MNILITGGTGFLGSYLVRELAQNYETVYVLSRQEKLNKFSDLSNVKFLLGDITNFDILSSKDEKSDKDILNSIDVIVHAAALYDLSACRSDCFLQNVIGTQNIMHLADNIKTLKAFYYISTIAVGDPFTFFLEEEQLPKRSIFVDAYSESKYIAEKMIRDNKSSHYVTRIFRPGIVIGDSKGSEMPKIDGPYYFIEAFKKHAHLLKRIPIIPLSFNPRAKIPLIPVDHCSRFIKLLIERDDFKKEIKTYHLVSADSPTLQEFLGDLNQRFGVKTHYIPIKENRLYNSLLKLLGIPKEVLPFMFSRLSYDKTRTLEDLPEIKESSYSSFKSILFGKS
ncbi:MAG: SDR family oxidoreductase [Bdellovibrionales bacterium]|nr:SDR family oxidoreductase [Bdellovibrionales bacterium]